MTISIIVRTKNEEKSIERTLDQISSQKIDIPFEIIVIDSGSTDTTREIAGRYTSAIFPIPSESFTFGYALNYGIERAKGAIIVNLSAHCIPATREWLSELIAPIREGRADAVYGRQIPVRGVNPFEEVSLYKHFPELEKPGGRVPFSNANCAFLKTMWEEVKFDEDLPSWEDYLWYLLLKDRHRFEYRPKAMVYHSHRFSLGAVKRRSFNDGKAFRMLKERYGIELIDEDYPTITAKGKLFLDDMRNHMKFFKREGYLGHIFFVPVVRFFAFKAYRDGYKSIE